MKTLAEGTRTRPEFRVVTKGTDKLHRWMVDMGNLSYPDVETTGVLFNFSLELGGTRIGDDVLEGALTALNYTPQMERRYDMQTHLVFSQGEQEEGKEAENETPQAVELHLPWYVTRTTTRTLTMPPDLPSLGKRIQSSGDMDVSVDIDGDLIIIPNATEDDEREYLLASPDPEQMSSRLVLNFAGQLSESRGQFEQDFGEYAGVLAQVVEALYAESGSPLPNTGLRLKAPPNMDTKMLEARQAVRQVSQQQNPILDMDGVYIRSEIDKIQRTPLAETRFRDIGGNAEAKERLQSIILAFTNPGLYSSAGLEMPRGYVLAGPTGVGKTSLVEATVNEIRDATGRDVAYLPLRLGDVLEYRWGLEEKKLSALFEHAIQLGEAVIFVDEIDSMVKDREGFANQVNDRLFSVFSTGMDDIRKSGANVVVFAASNYHEATDSALLRRFGEVIKIPLPDEDARKAIFDIHRHKAEQRAQRSLFATDFDIAQFVKATEGRRLNGDDVEKIVQLVLSPNLDTILRGEVPSLVTTEAVLEAAGKYVPIWQTKRPIEGFR